MSEAVRKAAYEAFSIDMTGRKPPQYLVLGDPEETDYLLGLLEHYARRWREHMASPTADVEQERKDLLKYHKFASEALARLRDNLEPMEASI